MENKTKTPLQRAQDKFTRVGTKLNEQDMAKFNEILEREGVNQSQYVKGLIMANMDYYKDLVELNRRQEILINRQKEKIENLEKEVLILLQDQKIEKLENPTFIEKIKTLFK